MNSPAKTKRLTFAVMMGTLSLIMQIAIPGIPLGVPGGKIELADLPAILGTSFSGVIGGIVCGFLYGAGSASYLAVIPSMMIILALLGYLTDHLKFRGRNAIAIVLSRIVIGPLLAAVFFKSIYFTSVPYTNVWLLCLTYAAPSAIICIPLYFALKRKIPNLLSSYKEKK